MSGFSGLSGEAGGDGPRGDGARAEGARGDRTETTGLVVVDKEPGLTSHDVVARCRRIFGLRRVGHAGTLDPDATGVLLVGLGRATRLLRFLSPLGKVYTAEIVLGTATSTLDASGTVTGTWDMGGVTLQQARAAASALTGPIMQVPPMVSALKVGGRRLHELAREGVEVDRPARPVTVDRFELAPGDAPGLFRAEVACSSGTYIRVLAADLGAALGGGAHVRNLRRTAVGSFTEAEAHPLGSLAASCILTPAEAMRDLDQVPVPPEMVAPASRGLPLDRVPLGAAGEGPWALTEGVGGRLLAVYGPTGTDRIRPLVVAADPSG